MRSSSRSETERDDRFLLLRKKINAFCAKRAAVALAVLAMSGTAHADSFSQFVQFSCWPEIGLFEMQATGAYNLDELGFDWKKPIPKGIRIGNGSKESALVWLDVKEPSAVTCDLPRGRLEVRLSSNRPTNGACGAGTTGLVSISEKNVPLIDRVPFDADCAYPFLHRIAIDQLWRIHLCATLSLDDNGFETQRCIWFWRDEFNRKAPITAEGLRALFPLDQE